MIQTAMISAVVSLALSLGAAPQDTAANIYESAVPPKPRGQIDKLVFAKLADLGIQPVLCSDAVFLRRAYIDITGTLPTAQEAREFIQSTDANKRAALIDRLMQRDEFADYWAMKWGDILRIKAEFPVNLWPNAAQAYHRWVRAAVASNMPYDKFVRELLTSSGSNFRVGPVNFYRAVQNRTPDGLASAAALAFMGSRTDSWPADRLQGMAVFFSQVGYKSTREWKEQVVFWDPLNSAVAFENVADAEEKPKDKAAKPDKPEPPPAPIELKPLKATFPDGTKVVLNGDRDPREVFADWLITPKNPWFAKAIVNRAWNWFLGRGIIHEPDDIRPDNPPSNPALLAYLEQEFIASRYNMKHLFRLILNSSTYQFSSMPRYKSPMAEANFASYPHQRLEAEVLIDAIQKITGTSDLYTSAIPEPYTYIPKDKTAVAIGDGSITSPFLTMFGRSARATGMENERINKPVPAQWLHMLNSSHIQRKIEQGPKLMEIFTAGRKPSEIVEELYLTILSRFPTPEEVSNAIEYGHFNAKPKLDKRGRPVRLDRWQYQKKRDDWVDVIWSLFNSTEFLYRH